MAEACLSRYLYLTAEKAQPGARGRPTAYEKFSIPRLCMQAKARPLGQHRERQGFSGLPVTTAE